MSLRTQRVTVVPPQRHDLPAILLAGLFRKACSIEGLGKRKVDGTPSETRQGAVVSLGWSNERFRQVMVLIREFRVEWPGHSLLTADDVSYIKGALDAALASALEEEHVADVYDMNPTVWAIWFVQHVKAVRIGSWTAESTAQQERFSFENLYAFLQEQHARGERFNVYDETTHELLHRYKLPFRRMVVPPHPRDMFKYRRGARTLSKWMTEARLKGFAPGIINMQPPALVDAPPLQSRREQARQTIWRRVAQRANNRGLQSVRGYSDDSMFTRSVINTVMNDSGAGGTESEGSLSDDGADELEAQLEAEMEAAQQQPPSGGAGNDANAGQQSWPLSDLLAELQDNDEPGPAPPLAGNGDGGGAGPSSSASTSAEELSEYEQQRLANIARNKRLLEQLGLGDGPGLGARRPPAPPRDPFPPGNSGAAPSRRSTRERKSLHSDEVFDDRGSSAEDSDGD